MIKRFVTTLAAAVLTLTHASAQTAATAAATYNRFAQYINSGQEAAAYPALYESYEMYLKLLEASSPASAEHQQAATALTTIYPHLQKGAFFYAAQNNQAKTLQYAQAYVGLSVMPAMQAQHLPRDDNYAQVAMLAAFNTWNNREVAKSIPYMQAYISTGDTRQRKEAYDCLGKAFYLTKNYSQAQVVLEEGLRLYPGTWSMLVTIINACGENHDDEALLRYLKQALAIKPGEEALLANLGKVYEKQKQWQRAAEAYEQLRRQKPQSLDVARHLAQDYYNAGITAQNLSATPKLKKAEVADYQQQARQFFAKAEPLLNNILASEPLSVNYAYALATVYASLGQTAEQQSMNHKIEALGFTPVPMADKGQQPQLALMDIDAPQPTPAASAASPSTLAAASSSPLAANSVPAGFPSGSASSTASPSPLTAATSASSPLAANSVPAGFPSGSASSTASPSPTGSAPVVSVDTDIPITKAQNERTFVVVIANEHYKKVAGVPMADADGHRFAEYCQKVLGVPQVNIRTYYDATNLEMEDALDDITRIASACRGDLRIIFYYAGHGVPDAATKEAFLLPIDSNGRSTRGCLALSELYNRLGALQANSVLVFLDACFSGAMRNGNMLVAERGVAIKAKPSAPTGNMVVFSATTGEQTAMAYEAAGHGLFTYYLLRKLKESRGNVTLGDLTDYVCQQVELQSQLVNFKSQSPTVTATAAMGDGWKKLRLNKEK